MLGKLSSALLGFILAKNNLANELLSITENIGATGLPLPDVMKKAVEILGGKGKK